MIRQSPHHMIAFCVCLFSLTGAHADTLDGAELLDALDAVRTRYGLPAYAVMVTDSERTLLSEARGLADVASGRQADGDTRFRIGSITKAFTSMALLLAEADGDLSLDDQVRDIVPEAAYTNPWADTDPVRVAHLLEHTAGFQDWTADEWDSAESLDLAVALAFRPASRTCRWPPGRYSSYSNSGAGLAAKVLQTASGRSYEAFVEQRIFAPLGMNDTYFYIPDGKADRLVTLYADVDGLRVSVGDESSIVLDNPKYPVEGAKAYFSGGAGLSSTAYDYARFVEMLLNNGELDGERVLGRKSVELMRSPRIDWDDDGDTEFSLGFEVIDDLGESGELGSKGIYRWGGAFATSYWIDPEEQLVAVLMTQQRPSKSELGDRFRTLVYQALE